MQYLTPEERKAAKAGDPHIIVDGELKWGHKDRR